MQAPTAASQSTHVRLGSALFNADHMRLGDELKRVEDAGIEFIHVDVFDGYAVPDQGFPARTVAQLRKLTKLPFEVHLTANDPLRFVPALADAGVDLIFLPAETTPMLYEATFELRQRNIRAGLCLALGTPLEVLEPVLPMMESVLLLGRVTGEGARGRAFNDLVLRRVFRVRQMIDSEESVRNGTHQVDLQAAGGLELDSSVQVCRLGATSLPLGSALHREQDLAAYVTHLRGLLAEASSRPVASSQ
jgi:ribulose-phosphate 3-epimerase